MMHISKRFEAGSFAEIFAEIETIRFGTLVCRSDDAFDATPIPWVPVQQGSELHLYGHLANANPQLEILRHAPDSLVIFTGVNAYISPRGLPTPRSAPTWNYVAVHVHGHCDVLNAADTEAAVEMLVAAMENTRPEPWRTKEMESRREQLMRHVTGIRVQAKRMDAKFKLGQNENAADYSAILENLRNEGRDELVDRMLAANAERIT